MSDWKLALRHFGSHPWLRAWPCSHWRSASGQHSDLQRPVSDPGRLVTVSSAYALGHGYKAGAGMN